MDDTILIKYSKKQLRYSLIFGTFLLLIFIGYLIFNNGSFFGYGYLLSGLFFMGTYFYKKFFHYATIENGVFKKSGFKAKQIKLNQVEEVNYFAGEYKLVSKNQLMKINTMEIDAASLIVLKKIFANLKTKK